MSGVKEWLAKASGDLKSSRKLIKDDDETLDSAAYFTQQSAEKALKAYLIFRKQVVPRTHDLERLLELCMHYEPLFGHFLDDVLQLSPFATYSRYPDDRFYVDRTDVLNAISSAEKILKFVKSKIEIPEKTPQLELFEK